MTGLQFDAQIYRNGPSSARPPVGVFPDDSCMFFDTTLGLPIFWNGRHWTKHDGTVVADFTLPALTLSAASLASGAPAGTVIGSILGKTPSSRVTTSIKEGRVALAGSEGQGWRLVRGRTGSTSSFSVDVKEEIDSAPPRTTTLAITIT